MKQVGSSRTQHIYRWLNSHVFWIWLVLSMGWTVVHVTVPFVVRRDIADETSRIFIFEGASTVVNVALSCVLAYLLPGFIKQVRLVN